LLVIIMVVAVVAPANREAQLKTAVPAPRD
jgi:hypothetical protein